MTTYKSIKYNFSGADLTSLPAETKPVVSSVSPSTITNDAQNIVITGTDFVAIPRVDIINTATGIWYSTNSVTRDSATQLTVNVTLGVDAGTYRIRVENPDGNSGISAASFLTVSDAPVWTTSSGSLGTIQGDFSGTVATVAATGDTVTYSETTNVLTNASLANCSLNSSTGVITTSDFDGSSTTARTHTFTIRATDAQSQTVDREFTLTSKYTYVVDFLVIAGGGGGGGKYYAGGGGAGGYRNSYASEASGGGGSSESALEFAEGTVYTVTVGAGGAGGASSTNGTQGGTSSVSGSDITDITTVGGGHGTTFDDSGTYPGGDGGSAGGTAGWSGTGGAHGVGSGTANQGYNGGTSGIGVGGGANSGTGGGGGAGSVGGSGSGTDPGDGGAGLSSSITGSAVTRAAGGGGMSYYFGDQGDNGGSSGIGGRGAYGQHSGAVQATAGDTNTGSGGGGASHSTTTTGGAGGSGVVILRMATADYSGTTSGSPTVDTDGSDTILIFNASGSYTG